MTSTRVGATVPAAVIIIGNNLPMRAAAMSTALYPAAEACDERASIDWARDMRGSSSRLKAVTPRLASALTMSPWVEGCRKLISTAPSRSSSTSVRIGACTLSTASASFMRSAAWVITFTPTASNASSGMKAPAPAPASTATSSRAAISLVAVSGTRATRRSSCVSSLGVATFTS